MEAAGLVLRPGEESQQLGDDASFVFRFKKALRQEPLAASVLDSLRPLADAHGLDMEELAFIIADHMVLIALLGVPVALRGKAFFQRKHEYLCLCSLIY